MGDTVFSWLGCLSIFLIINIVYVEEPTTAVLFNLFDIS